VQAKVGFKCKRSPISLKAYFRILTFGFPSRKWKSVGNLSEFSSFKIFIFQSHKLNVKCGRFQGIRADLLFVGLNQSFHFFYTCDDLLERALSQSRRVSVLKSLSEKLVESNRSHFIGVEG